MLRLVDEQSGTLHGPIRIWLTVFAGAVPQRTVEVTKPKFLIGRGDECDLVLEDPKVSREHAVIMQGVGPFRTVRDLDSANGTLVDGRPLRPRLGFTARPIKEAELSGAEWLHFGDTPVLVSLVDPRQGGEDPEHPPVPPGHA